MMIKAHPFFTLVLVSFPSRVYLPSGVEWIAQLMAKRELGRRLCEKVEKERARAPHHVTVGYCWPLHLFRSSFLLFSPYQLHFQPIHHAEWLLQGAQQMSSGKSPRNFLFSDSLLHVISLLLQTIASFFGKNNAAFQLHTPALLGSARLLWTIIDNSEQTTSSRCRVDPYQVYLHRKTTHWQERVHPW